jgi:hypothetical protein
MTKSEKEQDAFIEKMNAFAETLSEDDISAFAGNVIYVAAMFGGRNHYESMGILQCALLDFQRSMEDYIRDEMKKEKKKK